MVRPAQIELPKDRPADLPLPDLHAPIIGVSTDSRSIRKGQMFIALRGENFDGHKFIADAVKGGAPIVVVEDEIGVEKGTELGAFEMGSTVILLFEPGRAALLERVVEGARVRVGEPVGGPPAAASEH